MPPRRVNRANGLPGGRKKRPATTQQAKCCDEPKIEDRDGAKICSNCFTQISEANIVADVTFEENANGSATVQGGFLGENARHASTLNSTAFRRMGGGERNNIEEIQRKGQDQLNTFRGRLHLAGDVFDQAINIWHIAARNNFTAGRSLEEVVAACAYAALRRQRDNTVLLIDVAEIIKINVFRLGEVYKTMCRELYLGNNDLNYQHIVDVEPLIMKYCDKLEFHDDTRRVAEDALKIVRRMKRDWMVTGRHPAGLCGACIILAARMNNYKRTVREVVYVSKIADATISKRIEEFRRTKSAALTVNQFRKYANRLKHQHDPPSVYEGDHKLEKLEKKKRKRQALQNENAAMALDGAINIDDQSDAESTSGTPAPESGETNGRQRKRARSVPQDSTVESQEAPRFDADGFAIPALPARLMPTDPAIIPVVEGLDGAKKRGRPRKNPAPAPVQISEGELLLEEELEGEIEEALDDAEVNKQREQVLKEKEEARSQDAAEKEKRLEAQRIRDRRAAAGIKWHNSEEYNQLTTVSAAELEDEFKDDLEVENCILSDQQAREKEKIWLFHNEDWLREQCEKDILKQIAAAAPPKQKKGKGGKKKGKKGGECGAAAGTPAETPADAAAAMLAEHAGPNFSRHINYEVLGHVYNHDKSRSVSRAGSEAPSVSQAGGGFRVGTPDPNSGASPEAEGLPTPAATQPRTQQQGSPVRRSAANTPAPRTPEATQAHDAQAGAEQQDEEQEEEEDAEEPEEAQDEDDEDTYRRFRFPGDGDDDDDYDGGYGGDDDYEAALDPTHGASIGGTW